MRGPNRPRLSNIFLNTPTRWKKSGLIGGLKLKTLTYAVSHLREAKCVLQGVAVESDAVAHVGGGVRGFGQLCAHVPKRAHIIASNYLQLFYSFKPTKLLLAA